IRVAVQAPERLHASHSLPIQQLVFSLINAYGLSSGDQAPEHNQARNRYEDSSRFEAAYVGVHQPGSRARANGHGEVGPQSRQQNQRQENKADRYQPALPSS